MSNSEEFQQLGADFQLKLKDFIQRSEQLTKNSLLRVQKALAAYPLEDELVTLVQPNEKEVYKLGVDIQSIKLNMMVESLKQDAEEERRRISKG